ncbi:MAG: SMP-30/gluconolactonase/LRE family protein [Aeromonas sp.]
MPNAVKTLKPAQASLLLADYRGHLPECPTWDAASQTLYWTDILAREIHAYTPHSQKHQIVPFSEEVGCFALRERGGFIVALRTGIYLTDATGQIERKVADNPNNPALARFNDGGCDQLGRFYAGTYWAPRDFNGALLCRVDSQLKLRVIQHDILGANGLAFSPDMRWMYTTDTPNRRLYRTLLKNDDCLGQRQLLREFAQGDGVGRPDGAAMDVEGCYWSALFDGHRIARFSPTGELLSEYALPVRCPTMVCFGGEDMRTLFITTTRENMSADELRARPLSGALFTLRVPIQGMPKPRFKEQN